MNQLRRSARFFRSGVRPGHLVALGAILFLCRIVVPGMMGNGLIVLVFADIWWILERLPHRHGSDSGSGPTGTA